MSARSGGQTGCRHLPNVIDISWKGGPYVQVAAFCEQVLQERDGVHSLIRIIDTVTQIKNILTK